MAARFILSSLFDIPSAALMKMSQMLKETENTLLGAPKSSTVDETTSVSAPTVPGSYFNPQCHRLEPEMTEKVDGYFIKHWGFKNEAQIKKFRAAGFPRVTCCYYPEAQDDRIYFACMLLTILFLIDDLLEDMSLEDGKAYNDKLMPIMRGDVLPDRNIPVQWIMYDLWDDMRTKDKKLADEILEPTFTFMRAQTDSRRMHEFELGSYLEYRERDVGKALLSALMRYVMQLEMTPVDLTVVSDVDLNCSKHISVINDIFSWEKELQQSKESAEEGSVLCSSVQVMADEANVTIDASKRILFSMCREWELVHNRLVEQKKRESIDGTLKPQIEMYCKGLEYQMSGNEMWSSNTLRYIGV